MCKDCAVHDNVKLEMRTNGTSVADVILDRKVGEDSELGHDYAALSTMT